MDNVLVAFFISLGVTAISGAIIIPILRRIKAGQSIREVGPKWHMTKQGTPTMGGIIFILGITAAVVFTGIEKLMDGDFSILFVPAFAIVFGIIGFIDDFVKVVKKRNLGLTSLQKLILQLSASGAFVALLRYFGFVTPNVYIPFVGVTVPIEWLVYTILALLYVVGFVNAVNLTDGVDGLATGVTLPIAVFFVFLSLQWSGTGFEFGTEAPAGAVFAAALAGGLLGFLIYNFNPAKVFMGDTGSLYLGGAVCGLALMNDAPLLLIPLGAVYLIEIISVIIQVVYFKLSGGKRVFKMTPIHHHFEMSGWGEKKLFFVFMGITVVMCVVTWLGVCSRYQV